MRRSRSNLRALLLLCALLLGARSLQAQDEGVSSTECCIELLAPIGARTVSLGEAVTARPGEDAMFVNPAGLAVRTRHQFMAHRSTIADAKRTTLGGVFAMKDVGVFAIAYDQIDYGTQETSDAGGVTGTLGFISQQLIASFATRMSVGWNAGVNYRLFDFRASCQGTQCADLPAGTTHLVDAGVTYEPRWLPAARLGAALVQVGFPLQVENAAQADPTPARLRIGGAYEAAHHFSADTSLTVWVSLDAVVRAREPSAPALNLGVEVELDRTIFFRAGHSTSGDGITSGGTAVGLGVKYQRFDVSVAKSVNVSPIGEGEPFHVSFGVAF